MGSPSLFKKKNDWSRWYSFVELNEVHWGLKQNSGLPLTSFLIPSTRKFHGFSTCNIFRHLRHGDKFVISRQRTTNAEAKENKASVNIHCSFTCASLVYDNMLLSGSWKACGFYFRMWFGGVLHFYFTEQYF